MRGNHGRPASRSPAGHELVDHTSEVTLRLRAPDFAALLAEATAAFAELVPDGLRAFVDGQARELVIQAPDRAAALVEWLNEMVYLSDACQWIPTSLDVRCRREGEYLVRAEGESLSAPFVRVKAATLHGAFVRDREGGLEAEVTLDL